MRERGSARLAVAFLLVAACSGEKRWNQPLAPALPQSEAAQASFESALDIVNCEVIHGWVWSPAHPGTAVTVEILGNGRRLALLDASEYRQDLKNAGKGNGSHAFTFPTPVSMMDRHEHLITARVAGTNQRIGTADRPLRCSFEFPANLKKTAR